MAFCFPLSDTLLNFMKCSRCHCCMPVCSGGTALLTTKKQQCRPLVYANTWCTKKCTCNALNPVTISLSPLLGREYFRIHKLLATSNSEKSAGIVNKCGEAVFSDVLALPGSWSQCQNGMIYKYIKYACAITCMQRGSTRFV